LGHELAAGGWFLGRHVPSYALASLRSQCTTAP
jgi:hypothetical protein